MSRKILVIGASGYVGGVLAAHLNAKGHDVSGLARSERSAAKLQSSGIKVITGDIEEDLSPVLASAASADAVIYAAQIAFDKEPGVIRLLCQALAGTGKTLLFLSGSGVLIQRTNGAWSADSFAEDDPFTPEPLALPRVEAEGIVRAAANEGVRSMVVRPPVIWGPGDNGPVANIYRSIATTGAACYIGTGLATYANVHSADLAELFSLALEHGRPGALYHAVGGEIPFRWIAEAVARDMGVETRSLTMEQAAEVFGPFGALLQSACSRIRDAQTRSELGWTPTRLDMLSMIGEPRLRALANPTIDQETQR